MVHVLLPAPETTDPTHAEPARVGFVVSRGVGNAVGRNLVKRRLREIVSHELGTLPDGALVVIRALPAAAEASYAELREGIARSTEVAMGKQRRGAR